MPCTTVDENTTQMPVHKKEIVVEDMIDDESTKIPQLGLKKKSQMRKKHSMHKVLRNNLSSFGGGASGVPDTSMYGGCTPSASA